MSQIETHMTATGQRTRLGQALVLLLCACLAGLIGRLVYINTQLAPRLRAYSYPRQTSTILVPGSRGAVLDRRYRLLAGTTDQFAVYADPRLIADRGEAARAVAAKFGLSERDIREKLDRPTAPGYVVLCRTDENPRDKMAGLKLRGLGVQREPVRVYPMGNLAAHVLGYVGIDGKGLEGVELGFDARLASTPGRRTVFCDVRRNPVFSEPDSYVPPKNGTHVVLTIDANIQEKLEEQVAERVKFHEAASGLGLVMDPKTGEILALANYPTFDPAKAGDAPPPTRRNRVLTDPVEPGSVFKPYVMSAVLTHHTAKRTEVIDCRGGVLMIGKRILHDSHPHGALTVDQVLAQSSNIGMALLGMRLGNAKIYNMLHDLGFGERTGIDLGGEDKGLMLPLKRWTLGSTASVPMGQEIAVTPMQLATAFCSLVNGGRLLRPHVVAAVVDDQGEILEDHSAVEQRRQSLDPDVARQMAEMLAMVVTEGTGRQCKLENWQVMGKTGTAQIPRIGQGRRGYEPNAYVGSFIAAAPASDPVVVVLMMVRHPRKNGYYGAQVALPGVKEVLRFTLNYLNVPHDAPASGPLQQLAGEARN
ncbi:MAG: penicillin-binding protein 2 [Planctomycetes bacterium]|nr:penicillin-binding protein 2 [Planctomycetota bacterium]